MAAKLARKRYRDNLVMDEQFGLNFSHVQHEVKHTWKLCLYAF